MADKALCSIPDCGKTFIARGLCAAHYRRWRDHGDPLAGRIVRGTAVYAIEEALRHSDVQACWLWPHAKAEGRARIRLNGKLEYAHRVVCERVFGLPPTPEHVTAHTCGNGHLGCVSPHHVRWATQTENMADCLIHGTVPRGERNGRAKLTEADVRLARKLYIEGSETHESLAKRFGVTREAMRDIINRKRWAWLI